MKKKTYEQLESTQSFYRVLTVFMGITIAIMTFSINAMEYECDELAKDLSIATAKNKVISDDLNKVNSQIAMGLCLPVLEIGR